MKSADNRRLLIISAGCVLYGERWQTPLALALGINPRTVRRWLTGEGAPSQHTLDDVVVLLWKRQRAMLTLIDQIAREGNRE